MNPTNDDRGDQLLEAVNQLADEVRVLVTALDEIREELQWANRNVGDPPLSKGPRFRLTSMPLDPGTLDWQLNRVDQGTVDQLRSELSTAGKTAAPQGRLF